MRPCNFLFPKSVSFPTIIRFLQSPYTKTYNYLVNTLDGCAFCGDVTFVKIWDRWGNNLVFSQSISKSKPDVQGFAGEEIVWDGTFNGQPVAESVYVAVINSSSCYYDAFYCNDCYSDSPF